MIIIGWGKQSKKIADAGIMKCKNCNNYSAFEVRELANNIKLYFIPIAKWGKKTYLVCTICDAGYELNEEGKKEILQETIKIPDNKTSIEIFNKVDSLFVKYAESKAMKDLKGWDREVKRELKGEGYREEDIDYILAIYAESLLDSIKE